MAEPRVKSQDGESLEKLAAEALERFEERIPYILWNEMNATHAVGLKPPLDIALYHQALDAWEKDLHLLLQLSSELYDAQRQYVEAVASRLAKARALRETSEKRRTRDSDFQSSLDRIRNLRKLRPL
jgi:hypothetical protein